MKAFILITLLATIGIIHADTKATMLFEKGLEHYQKKQYTAAIPVLKNAVNLVPENAAYHHILAISYGRQAEQENWFGAINLAKKSLRHLEIAATLDNDNVEILDDLMDFYREAPKFLGGDQKKADEIEILIETLSQ